MTFMMVLSHCYLTVTSSNNLNSFMVMEVNTRHAIRTCHVIV